MNETAAKLEITRIVVAYRPDTIAPADRVIRIDDGRIVADARRLPYQVETSKGGTTWLNFEPTWPASLRCQLLRLKQLRPRSPPHAGRLQGCER